MSVNGSTPNSSGEAPKMIGEFEHTGQVFKDDGGGVTEISLEYFRKVKPRLGRIVRAEASYEPLKMEPRFSGKIPYRAEYNLILTDDRGTEVWLSGCNCNYAGTGPHGTFEILKEAGLISEDADFFKTPIPTCSQVRWYRKDGEIFVAGK